MDYTSINNYTILIVDDTLSNLQVLFTYLKDVGFKVLVAQNGESALKKTAYALPDLILLDILMPGIDGFEVCRQLKAEKLTKDIPVIFMTAISETVNKVKGFQLGAVDFVTKPIEQEEVLARIQTHLHLQTLRQHLQTQNKKLQKQTEQERLLFTLSERIRQSLDIESILKTAATEVQQFLNCDRVLINRFQDGGTVIEVESVANGIEPVLPDLKQDYYLTPEEYQNYQQGGIQAIENIKSANPNCCCAKFLEQCGAKATLVMPIVLTTESENSRENGVWGLLILHHCRSTRKWNSQEIDLLKRLASQLAIALVQGSLYQKLATANQELKQLAISDPLTGVFNRRYFDEHLTQEWLRLVRNGSPLSLIMCDVDCFKAYNDTYGHLDGDKCLRLIAQSISNVVKRTADFVARYGGEEFVVVLPDTDIQGAHQVAEKISTQIQNLNIPHSHSSVGSTVTLSMGVATTIPSQEYNYGLLIEAADKALYLAKSQGRGCVELYQDDLSPEKSRQYYELPWIRKLRQAFEEDRFCLYAQSIKSLQGNTSTEHFEILLRLSDDDGKMILPTDFLEIADSYHLMPKIDRWVIENLFSYLALSDCQFLQNCWFSVNLSGATLNDNHFLDFVCQQFTKYNLPPHIFCFEITETVAISNLPKACEFINSLKALGCHFALDDFGTGMSSLAYLKNLPVDYLKIDGSFINDITKDPVAKAMVQAINQIAKVMGLHTIAEFVETDFILDTIRELGVDYAQGYYFGHPEVLGSFGQSGRLPKNSFANVC